MEKVNVVLFIPCYNVAGTILKVLEDLEPLKDRFSSIIFVDNGSTDGTRDLLRSYFKKNSDPRCHLLFNEDNYSLGGSTIVAFRKAIQENADFVVCMHSDGQACVADLAQFFPFRLNEDFVIGSRLMNESQVEDYSFVRLIANKFFSQLQKWIIKDDVQDIGAFLAFNMHTIKKIPYERIPANMAYHPSIVLYVYTQLKNIRTREFPIHWGKVETSNINVVHYGLAHLWRLTKFSLGLYKLSQQKLEDFKCTEIS